MPLGAGRVDTVIDVPTRVALVDYGVGNLFSIARSCVLAGLDPLLTSDAKEVANARAIILPGIGAFGDAMAALHQLRLVDLLRTMAADGVPVVGVCLGMQLLMEQSHEFGSHEGLGLVKGTVEAMAPLVAPAKTPHVGWSGISRPRRAAGEGSDPWTGTLLEGVRDGCGMYFVHSFRVVPASPSAALAVSRYGGIEFCAAITVGAMTGFQFHPERSGPEGLQIYRNLAALVSAETTLR
jgi:imidazole glycerol-phosphate synthase subunit HisH